MTSTDVERYSQPAPITAVPNDREWGHIERMSQMMAKSQMCPFAFKNKPEDIMVVALSLRDTGVPFTLPTLNQCYVIGGRMEMMAQLKVAIAARHGWDLWFEPSECDDTKAVVHYKAPGKPERTTEYTIDEAKAAHLLDEWVETWVPTGEKWPDGKPKNRKVTVTVAVDGTPVDEADMPEWARDAKAASPPVRKEPWFAHRPSMLMARAITKALRYAAPHLTLGMGDLDLDVGAADVETGEILDRGPHREVADAETVEPPARSVAPDGTTIPVALREPEIDDDTRDALLRLLTGELPGPVVDRVRDNARQLGIPNLKTHRVTRAHGALMLRLIDEAQQIKGGAAPADVAEVHDGPVPADVIDSQPEAGGYTVQEGMPF